MGIADSSPSALPLIHHPSKNEVSSWTIARMTLPPLQSLCDQRRGSCDVCNADGDSFEGHFFSAQS